MGITKKFFLFILCNIFLSFAFTITSCNVNQNIEKKEYDMSGVSFNDSTFIYDGNTHSIFIKGEIPNNLDVKYEGNNKIDIGEYEVTAVFIEEEGYKDVPNMTATMTIIESPLNNISFIGKTFSYNGERQYILIEGELPSGITVEYFNNGQTECGTYEVVAKFFDTTGKLQNLPDMTATMVIEKSLPDMSNISFEDVVYTYDGEEKKIEIKGKLPDDIMVSYTKNTLTNVGSIEVVASFISKNHNYLDIPDMTATLSIIKSSITGVYFEGKSVVYNGETHSLNISGNLPDGIEVTYTNNNQSESGTYEVIASFTDTTGNYNDIPDMTATLNIKKATYDMSEISFEDASFVYDGNEHSILINGELPIGVKVEYTNNRLTNVGSVDAIASFTIVNNNYNAIPNMSANLTITKANIANIEFNDKTIGYDGVKHSILIDGELPLGVEVKYTNNNQTECGTYEVTATFIDKTGNYKVPDDMTAILKIAYVRTVKYYDEDKLIFEDKVFDGEEYELRDSFINEEGSTLVRWIINGEEISPRETITIDYDIDIQTLFAKIDNDFTYMLQTATNDIYATITGYKGNKKELSIPEWVMDNNNFYKVQSIGSGTYGFSKIEGLTSVLIPNSITYIGERAFSGCTGLTEIVIPDSVTFIGSYAFQGCSGLTSIEVPNSVTYIGSGAFNNCSNLEKMILPFVGDGSNSISYSHFGYIFGAHDYSENLIYVPERLKDVVITNDTIIDSYAFFECKYLENIQIYDATTSIHYGAFAGCGMLEKMTLPVAHVASSVENLVFGGFFGKEYFEGGQQTTQEWYSWTEKIYKSSTFYIPYTLKEVKITSGNLQSGAFSNCTNLEIIELPNNISWIPQKTFFNCVNLKYVNIPNAVEVIHEKAFYNCSNLTSVTLPKKITKIEKDVFYNIDFEKVYYCGTIEDWCNIDFSEYSYLSNEHFYIKKDSEEWSEITKLEIPNTVSTIGKYQFSMFKNIKEIFIPDSVTSIEFGAFSNCSSLTNVIIPDSVTSLDYYVFGGCESLETITIPFIGVTTNTNFNNFFGDIFGSSQTPNSRVPSKLRTVIITKDDYIEPNAFLDCKYIESVFVTNEVIGIGSNSFKNCNSLKNIYYKGDLSSWCNIQFENKYSNPLYYADNLYLNGKLFEKEFLVFPDTVSSIGNYAFANYTSLKEIIIPDTIEHIGLGAFIECDNLEKITLSFVGENADGSGSTHFGHIFGAPEHQENDTYIPVSIKEVTLNCQEINDYAFSECRNIENLNFSHDLINIGSYAFSDCKGLTKIELPRKLHSIEIGAFHGCDNLTSIVLPFIGENEEGSGSTHFGYIFGSSIPSNLKEVEIVECKKIPYQAFSGCSNIENIILHEDLETIESRSFEKCTGLKQILIPDSVTNIGYHAFYECNNLEQITLPFVGQKLNGTENKHFGYIFGAYDYLNNNAYIPSTLKQITITKDEQISNYAFYGCENIEIVELLSTKIIGNSAFNKCSKLINIELTNCLTKIGNQSFSNCILLKRVILPDSLVTIGEKAFLNCSQIEELILPSSIKQIGANAFLDTSISNLYYLGDLSLWCKITFENEFSNPLNISKNAYINNQLLTENINIGDEIKTISSYAFANCEFIKNVNIDDSTILIESHAFYNNSNLVHIDLPNSLECIEEYAFANCVSLATINIPYNVTFIGERAFSGCINLNKIDFSKSLEIIQQYALEGCISLDYVEIPKDVVFIGEGLFSGCKNLEKISIPFVGQSREASGKESQLGYIFGSIKYDGSIETRQGYSFIFGEEVIFYLPNLLTEIEVTNCTSIEHAAFENCINLVTINLNEPLESVGLYAFYNCINLENLFIPNTLKKLEINNAFEGCNKLKYNEYKNGLYLGNDQNKYIALINTKTKDFEDYEFNENIRVISAGVFQSCENLKYIEIPENVYYIGTNCFALCKELETIVLPKTIESISSNAFNQCNNLKNVYYNGNIESWCKISFANNLSNPVYYSNCLFIDDKLISEGELLIPDGVACIKAYSFAGFSKVTSIKFPESLKVIENGAFENCAGVTKIELPFLLETIGMGAFNGCKNIEEIVLPFVGEKFDGTGNVYFEYIFTNYSNNLSVPDRLKKITITNSVEINQPNIFKNCFSVEYILLPDNIEYVTPKAFIDCINLKYNEYYEGKYLGSENNPYLVLIDTNSNDFESLTIHPNTKIIASKALADCGYLVEITIPDSVNFIESEAFLNCNNLQSVNISDGVIRIGDSAFENCESLENVVIGNSVTSIEDSAFRNCNKIKSITIPNSVITIGGSAFKDCESLENVVIGNNLTEIGTYAFAECKSLESITIPNSVMTIDYAAFYGCNHLSSMKLPFIGQSREGGDSSLHYNLGFIFGSPKITENPTYVPLSLKTIIVTDDTTPGNFDNCIGIENIIFLSEPSSIGKFENCSNLKTMTIPDNMQIIAINKFNGCSSLESIIIGSGVTYIGNNVFKNCDSLTSVFYRGTIDEWNNIIFANEYSNPMYYASNFYLLNESGEWYDATYLLS